jgi:hypothetical protein
VRLTASVPPTFRDAVGSSLRHIVVTRLLEAGEPDGVVVAPRLKVDRMKPGAV